MATYKKNYLSSVILRMDIDPIELGKFPSFLESVKKEFPVSEQKEGQEGSFVLDMKTGLAQQTHNKRIYWQLSNLDKTKVVEIDSKYIYIEYKKYKDSKALLKDVENIFIPFIQIFKVQTAKRIGLRYINKIDFPKDRDYLTWEKYINADLIGGLAFLLKSNYETSRVLNQISLRKDDAYITFNYGVINDDFPNEIVKKQFTLDFDCASRFPTDVSGTDMVGIVKTYNKYVEELFEASIEEGLRTTMR